MTDNTTTCVFRLQPSSGPWRSLRCQSFLPNPHVFECSYSGRHIWMLRVVLVKGRTGTTNARVTVSTCSMAWEDARLFSWVVMVVMVWGVGMEQTSCWLWTKFTFTVPQYLFWMGGSPPWRPPPPFPGSYATGILFFDLRKWSSRLDSSLCRPYSTHLLVIMIKSAFWWHTCKVFVTYTLNLVVGRFTSRSPTHAISH